MTQGSLYFEQGDEIFVKSANLLHNGSSILGAGTLLGRRTSLVCDQAFARAASFYH